VTDNTIPGARIEVDPEQACPIAPVVDIVFSRWTTPILWALNEYGRQRFVELERRITTITPKVMTQRLRQLERDGLVVRTYHPEVPRGWSTKSANWDAAWHRCSQHSPSGPSI
jgi:DNA-binding HxlR family transcriptional regulator